MDSRLNILFVANHQHRGGGYQDLVIRLNKLDSVSFSLVLLDPPDDVLEHSKETLGKNVRSISLNLGKSGVFFRYIGMFIIFFKLLVLIRSRRFTIVSTNGFRSAALSSLAVPFTSAKLVVRVHAKQFYSAHPYLSRYIALIADSSLHVSEYTAGHGWPSENAEVVRSPVDTDAFESIDDTDQGIGVGGPCIGMVGRLEPVKGHIHLIKAASFIIKDYPMATFLIIGDTNLEDKSYSERLNCLISKEGVSSNFQFLGWRDDIPSLLDQIDVLVVPSEEENIPKVIQEAFIRGTPVVAHDVGGISEIVTQDSGWLVEKGNHSGLSNAIKEVLEKPGEADRRVKKGQRLVRTKYLPEPIIERELGIYHKLLGRK